MKLICLEVLCFKNTDESSNQAYKNVLEELNLSTQEDETYWKEIYFSLDLLKEELFTIEARNEHSEQSLMSFYDNKGYIVNKEFKSLAAFLNDTE